MFQSLAQESAQQAGAMDAPDAKRRRKAADATYDTMFEEADYGGDESDEEAARRLQSYSSGMRGSSGDHEEGEEEEHDEDESAISSCDYHSEIDALPSLKNIVSWKRKRLAVAESFDK